MSILKFNFVEFFYFIIELQFNLIYNMTVKGGDNIEQTEHWNQTKRNNGQERIKSN